MNGFETMPHNADPKPAQRAEGESRDKYEIDRSPQSDDIRTDVQEVTPEIDRGQEEKDRSKKEIIGSIQDVGTFINEQEEDPEKPPTFH